jgi:hypothetical protein
MELSNEGKYTFILSYVSLGGSVVFIGKNKNKNKLLTGLDAWLKY